MKYKVGDKLVVNVTVVEVRSSGSILLGTAPFGDVDSRAIVNEKELDGIVVERAAAAYAAKSAPAPVSTAWEPKRDEVVLVEMEFVREKAGGEVYVQKGDGNFIAVPRSAIVGPAPVRARFAVGDVVVYVPTVEVAIIRAVNEIAGCYTASQDGSPTFIALEADLLTLDEARERLGKK